MSHITKITKISKIEAVKRQVNTAIQLYFHQMDPVAIHTLTCAAHEILVCMCKKKDKTSL